jgi:hypothetical protein
MSHCAAAAVRWPDMGRPFNGPFKPRSCPFRRRFQISAVLRDLEEHAKEKTLHAAAAATRRPAVDEVLASDEKA